MDCEERWQKVVSTWWTYISKRLANLKSMTCHWAATWGKQCAKLYRCTLQLGCCCWYCRSLSENKKKHASKHHHTYSILSSMNHVSLKATLTCFMFVPFLSSSPHLLFCQIKCLSPNNILRVLAFPSGSCFTWTIPPFCGYLSFFRPLSSHFCSKPCCQNHAIILRYNHATILW